MLYFGLYCLHPNLQAVGYGSSQLKLLDGRLGLLRAEYASWFVSVPGEPFEWTFRHA